MVRPCASNQLYAAKRTRGKRDKRGPRGERCQPDFRCKLSGYRLDSHCLVDSGESNVINLHHPDTAAFSSNPHSPSDAKRERRLATYRIIAVVFGVLGFNFFVWAFLVYVFG